MYEREGVLVEFTGGFRKKGDRKGYTYSQVEKERFYAQLKGYALTKGYQPGWAFYKYKEKFKVEPSWAMKSVPAMAPGPEVSAWIRHTQIQWAKSKKNPNNANEYPMPTSLTFELLALRLYVHGPEGMDVRVARRLSRGPLWLETRNLLRVTGSSFRDSSPRGRTPKGCACWECVIALNRAVRRTTNRKASSAPNGLPPSPARADVEEPRKARHPPGLCSYSSFPNCHHSAPSVGVHV